MEWKNEYSVGINEIDNQHKKLFEISEKLSEIQDVNEIKELFLFLENYIHFHFETEEKLMKEYNYPDYPEHKKIHEELTDKIKGYIELYLMGNFSLFDELEEIIILWIENHILVEDKKYSEFINNN